MPRRYRSRSKRRVSKKSKGTKQKTKRKTKRITRRKKGGVKQKRQRQGRTAVADAAAAAAADAAAATAAAAADAAALVAVADEPGGHSRLHDLTPFSAPAPRDEQQRIRREEAIDANTKWVTREQIDPVTGWGAHNNVMCGKFGCAFKTILEGLGDEEDFTDEAGNEWPERFRNEKIRRQVGDDSPLSREILLEMVSGLG